MSRWIQEVFVEKAELFMAAMGHVWDRGGEKLRV